MLFRIAGPSQAVGQLEEAFLFLLPGFDTGLDEINNDTVGARAAGLRQGFHPASDARGEAYALTDGFFGDRHGIRIHQLAPECTRNEKASAAIPAERVERSILVLRGHKVLLDADLAKLYGVETKVLLQALKRNPDRFPKDFIS